MYTLQIALKNGKSRTTAPMPVAQAFDLRHQLIDGKVAQIPGIGRINGEWVASVAVLAAGMDADTLLNTDQAAGCMRAEPYVHYRLLGGTLYQYSEMTQGYEACVRGVWRPAVLPLGAWVRVGGDSLAFLVAGDGEDAVWAGLAV
ncbi:hypothetical protein [Exiguobacterium sp. CinTr1]|uniref:hypothetical protein n=1 Tax=Exiguobacterium sp. CinTr1 TaxID=2995315 RepID=UPI0022E17EE4|nr:hypothetical protein [Exiguobacterium sp. CinTr1]